MYKERLKVDREIDSRREEVQRSEFKLATRERQLDRKVDLLNNKDRATSAKEKRTFRP